MSIRMVGAFVATFLVGASAGAGGLFLVQEQSAVHAARIAAEPAEEALLVLRPTMIDPDSTQVRDVVRRGEALCGEVNSRNRMGGYVGFRRFVVVGNDVAIDDDRSRYRNERLTALWVRHCDETAYSSTEES